jgi:hypothetical protein
MFSLPSFPRARIFESPKAADRLTGISTEAPVIGEHSAIGSCGFEGSATWWIILAITSGRIAGSQGRIEASRRRYM